MIRLFLLKKHSLAFIFLIIFCFTLVETSYGALPNDHPSITELTLQYELRDSDGNFIAYFEPTLMYIIDLALVHENLDTKEKTIIEQDGKSFELIQYEEKGIIRKYGQYSSYDMIYKGSIALAMRHDGYLGEPGDLFNIIWTIVRPVR